MRQIPWNRRIGSKTSECFHKQLPNCELACGPYRRASAGNSLAPSGKIHKRVDQAQNEIAIAQPSHLKWLGFLHFAEQNCCSKRRKAFEAILMAASRSLE
mmetsp:Transcript_8465/g.14814  ORF Transcript_8465/g.14814 Transcript_8465/m.14814 type:complete len:100 (-) Transcript_8465:300-599(-)